MIYLLVSGCIAHSKPEIYDFISNDSQSEMVNFVWEWKKDNSENYYLKFENWLNHYKVKKITLCFCIGIETNINNDLKMGWFYLETLKKIAKKNQVDVNLQLNTIISDSAIIAILIKEEPIRGN